MMMATQILAHVRHKTLDNGIPSHVYIVNRSGVLMIDYKRKSVGWRLKPSARAEKYISD